MKILLIFRFFHYICFIDQEKLCFLFWRKNDKVLKFDVVHFPNSEIIASLLPAFPVQMFFLEFLKCFQNSYVKEQSYFVGVGSQRLDKECFKFSNT